MPAGPKPDSDSEVEDDLKDIVMPEGPPPPKLRLGEYVQHIPCMDSQLYRTIDIKT